MPYKNMPKELWPKMEKCVADVKKKGSSVNAYAVCYDSIMGKGKHKAAKEMPGGGFVLDMELVEMLGYKQDKVKCPECDATVMPDKDGMCPECGADLGISEEESKEIHQGIKAFEDSAGGKHIVLWTSNAFEDREKEIFSTKAWQDYVDRRDSNGRKDRVWFWHVKGTDFATVEWQDVVGRFLLEVAKVDDTEYGHKMFHAIQHPEEYHDLLPQGWGTSHGYVYKLGDKQGGVYNWVEKFESTILPYHRASNMFGGIKEVLDMSMKKEKRDGLASLVGEELAEELTSEAEKATKTLEKKGVAHKGDKEEDEVEEVEEEEVETETDADEEGDTELYEMELDATTLKEIADKVDVKSVVDKAVKEAITNLKSELVEAVKTAAKEIAEKEVGDHKERVVKDVMSGKVRLRPYVATKSKDNVIKVKEAGDDIDLDDEDDEDEGTGKKGSPMDALPGAGVIKKAVRGMLSGTLG